MAAPHFEAESVQRQVVHHALDNLGRVTLTRGYDGDTVTVTTVNGTPAAPPAARLHSASATHFDARGRLWRSETFGVNPVTGGVGGVGPALASETTYDGRGNAVRVTPPGLGGDGATTKTAFDGAGRATVVYTLAQSSSATGWADAFTPAADVVLEQAEFAYDGGGRVLSQTTRQRFHTPPGAPASQTGPLGTPASTGSVPRARVSYAGWWYDAAGRPVAAADAGTNGGSAWSRPAAPPARSDDVLVTTTAYDAAGRVFSTVDPRGIDTRTTYDGRGRVVETIEAYTGNVPTDSADRTTRWTYDGVGNLTSMTAVLPAGQDDQVTTYTYAARTSRGDGVNSNRLLTATTYPSVGSGVETSESYTVNALGERVGVTDRNGTTRQLTYDVLGRLGSDRVTTFGANVDRGVDRLTYAFDPAGRPYTFTSRRTSLGGGDANIVNRVLREYNGFGQLTREYQSHTGDVNTATTPVVTYLYSEGTYGGAAANHSRLMQMTYPSGGGVQYVYGQFGSTDDKIGRVTSIADDAGITVETYAYLGLSRAVQWTRGNGVNLYHTTPPMTLQDITNPPEDPYTGLDRFGRVVGHTWGKTISSDAGNGIVLQQFATLDAFGYGHDAGGNRLYKQNLVNAAQSEIYHDGTPAGGYDALGRLTHFARGTLSAAKDGLAGGASREQSWDLDPLGNWKTVTTDAVAETRTHDGQNRLTGSASGSSQRSTEYSPSGEMLWSQEQDYHGHDASYYAYDAWGRMTSVIQYGVSNDGVFEGSATYAYDALGRRIARQASSYDGWDNHYFEDVHVFHSSRWQVLEEQDFWHGTTRYVWGGETGAYVDRLVLRDTPAFRGGTDRLYVQQDANYNVTALTNDQGQVVERYLYDPYGRRTVLAANWQPHDPLFGNQSLYAFAHGHQGGRHELGMNAELVHFRHRDLHVSLGRWTRQDPAGYVDGGSLYLAYRARAICSNDPRGLSANRVHLSSRSALLFEHELMQDVVADVAPPCSQERLEQLQKEMGGDFAGHQAWIEECERHKQNNPGPRPAFQKICFNAKGYQTCADQVIRDHEEAMSQTDLVYRACLAGIERDLQANLNNCASLPGNFLRALCEASVKKAAAAISSVCSAVRIGGYLGADTIKEFGLASCKSQNTKFVAPNADCPPGYGEVGFVD